MGFVQVKIETVNENDLKEPAIGTVHRDSAARCAATAILPPTAICLCHVILKNLISINLNF